MRGLGGGFVLLLLSAACAPIVPAPESPPASAEATRPAEPGATAAAEPPAAVAEAESPWLTVRDVRVEQEGNGRRIRIALSRAPERVEDFTLGQPARLVIDLAGPQDRTAIREARFPVEDDVVTRARVAPYKGRLRVVLDLNRSLRPHSVHQEGTELVAELGDIATAAAPPATEPATIVAQAPSAVERSGEGNLPSQALLQVAATEPAGEVKPADDPPPAAAVPPAKTPARVAERTPERVHIASVSTSDLRGTRQVFYGQKISLDFKDADIQNVLRVLADVSGLNIIATDDVKGKVTLHLIDVPWDQALDLVLRSNRLEKMQEGNVMRISTVSRLKEEREALRAADEAERELEPLRVKYVRVNYARADDVLIDKVKGVLTDRGSVTFDDRTNTVIVRDIGRGIDDASELIRELDVQSPQVLIEAHLVEATEDFARGLGVQWGYGYKAGPQTGNPLGGNFPGTLGVGGGPGVLGSGTAPPAAGAGVPATPVPFLADFPVPGSFGSGFGAGAGSALDLALGSLDGSQTLSARLTALEEEGKGKVISRPRVVTLNNVAATIQSLTILRVKLPSTGTVINTGTGGAAGSASTATEKINTGITLVVTPQISSDGYVLLNIYAKSSQPDFSHNVDGIPNEVSREANSNVLIRDGETIVLGGIFRNTETDQESGIPYLRSVPALGWLFKRNLTTNHHEVLMVFLTPKVMASGTAVLPAADQLWAERRQGG
jgi:type IV pilus assembly protein PilQ